VGQGAGTANTLAKTVITVLSAVVGIVAVIMIMFAGFRYVTSGGKEESVKSAKNTILYAIIGLVIVALAQIIVHFVLNKTVQASKPPKKSSSALASRFHDFGSSGPIAGQS
jgi:amino acid transporter